MERYVKYSGIWVVTFSHMSKNSRSTSKMKAKQEQDKFDDEAIKLMSVYFIIF